MKVFAVDTQFKQLRKRSLKKIQASAFEPVTFTGAVLYQLSYEAITVGSRSIFFFFFSGSIMPQRVIQHYSDWV